MFKIAGLIFIMLVSVATFAKVTETKPAVKEGSYQVRCEKLTGATLTDFKKDLVENCDLSKPFSSSVSQIKDDEVYFYCCHKR